MAFQDIQAPTWDSCPRSMVVFTDKGTNTASPLWERPTVTDNSGETVIVELTEGFEAGDNVAMGTYTIVYEAEDSSGNKATPCRFHVNVQRRL